MNLNKQPILWRVNQPLTPGQLNRLQKEIEEDATPQDADFYTSYGKTPVGDFLSDFYLQILDGCLKDLSLYGRYSYNTVFWVQKYTNTSNGHLEHDHFSTNEILSWVHFVQPAKSPSFSFVSFDGQVNTLCSEKPGDFIVFPPWAVHKTLPLHQDDDGERIVVAGNIAIGV